MHLWQGWMLKDLRPCSVREKKQKVSQLLDYQIVSSLVAERTRFELVVGLLLRQFSKLLVSATHPPFRLVCADFLIASAKLDIFLEVCKFSVILFCGKCVFFVILRL